MVDFHSWFVADIKRLNHLIERLQIGISRRMNEKEVHGILRMIRKIYRGIGENYGIFAFGYNYARLQAEMEVLTDSLITALECYPGLHLWIFPELKDGYVNLPVFKVQVKYVPSYL